MKSARTSRRDDEYLSLARRMRAAGVPLYIEQDDEPGSQKPAEGLLISQFGGFTESNVFQISSHMTGFCIYLKITSNISGPLEISRFDIELPWKDPSFHVLENPRDHDPEAEVYRFPGEPPLEFPIDEVINKYLHNDVSFSRGESAKGCLLALGGPMTDTIRHAETISAILNTWDQFGRKYSAPLSLYADRSRKFLAATRKRAYRPLLQCRDPKKTTGS